MKIWILLGMLSVYGSMSGQKDSLNCVVYYDSLSKGEVYRFVDSMPEPVGGKMALMQAITKKLSYKPDCEYVCGRLYLGFIVEPDSSTSSYRMVRDCKCILSAEAIEALKKLRWVPGSCGGKPVPVYMVLPVNVHPK